MLIVFYDMIADMLNNKKRNPIVTEFLIKGIKLNISFVFIRQSYFAVSKILNCILHTISLWKFQINENFNELYWITHQILTFNTFFDYKNLFKKYTSKTYSFLIIDTTLASDNCLRFRKNLLERILKLIMTIDVKIRDKKLQIWKTEKQKYTEA